MGEGDKWRGRQMGDKGKWESEANGRVRLMGVGGKWEREVNGRGR